MSLCNSIMTVIYNVITPNLPHARTSDSCQLPYPNLREYNETRYKTEKLGCSPTPAGCAFRCDDTSLFRAIFTHVLQFTLYNYRDDELSFYLRFYISVELHDCSFKHPLGKHPPAKIWMRTVLTILLSDLTFLSLPRLYPSTHRGW